jgi:HAE1 family hydrophobic/amphiphilic exporter-1
MFNSIKYPLIILSTIPLSIIGVLSGLSISSSTISLNSMLGVILLAGLVVNNGILLIDFYLRNISPEDTVSKRISSIKEACQLRLRPILMTTLTTLFAALPVALAFGDGGKVLQPLGVAIFFGLFSSTLMTLFLVPSILRLVDSQE